MKDRAVNPDNPTLPAHTLSVQADPQAELALIAAVMLEGHQILPKLALQPSDFFFSDTRATFAAILAADDRNEPLDFICVPPPDDDGTVRNTLMEALQLPLSGVYAPEYAKRIKDYASRRQLILLASQIADLSYQGTDPSHIASHIQNAIAGRQITATANKFTPWQTQVTTSADILDNPITDRPYVVQDILRANSLSIWYGQPGSLKSALLMDLAVCVANGLPWLSHPDPNSNLPSFPTLQTKTLWLNYDQSSDDVIERLAALTRNRSVAHNLAAINFSNPPAILTSTDTALQLADWIAANDYQFIIVDSLVDIKGRTDLQDAEMGSLLNLWRIVAETSNSVIALISHTTKATQDLYGSTFIRAKLDHAYHIIRPAHSDQVLIQPTKQRGYGINQPIGAEWTWTHFQDTRTLHTASFHSAPALHSPSADPDSTAAAALLFLMNHPGRPFSIPQIAEQMPNHPTQNSVRTALHRHTESGYVHKDKSNPGEQLYWYGDRILST